LERNRKGCGGDNMPRHKIFVLVGESGSGKSLAVNTLEDYYGSSIIRTHTTRPIRPDDDKICDTYENYLIEKENGTDIAYTFFDDNHYWTSINDIDFDAPYSVIILDKNGIDSIKESDIADIVTIKISSEEGIRIQRMLAQQRTFDLIQKRLKNDEVFFKDIQTDYSVKNIGPVDIMVKKIYEIIKKEINDER